MRHQRDPAQRRDHRPYEAGPFGRFPGERLEGAENDGGAGEPGFQSHETGHFRYIARAAGERGRVQGKRVRSDVAQGGDGEPGGIAAPAAQMDEPDAGAGRGCGPPHIRRMSGRVRVDLVEHAGEPDVGPVVAEQVRGDPVAHGHHPGQRGRSGSLTSTRPRATSGAPGANRNRVATAPAGLHNSSASATVGRRRARSSLR